MYTYIYLLANIQKIWTLKKKYILIIFYIIKIFKHYTSKIVSRNATLLNLKFVALHNGQRTFLLITNFNRQNCFLYSVFTGCANRNIRALKSFWFIKCVNSTKISEVCIFVSYRIYKILKSEVTNIFILWNILIK